MIGPVLSLAAGTPTDDPDVSPDDTRFFDALATAFIDEFTRPGDLVFDPFAGYGTTLVVAERLGRRAFGLEILPDRVDHIRSRLADPSAVVEADARRVGDLSLPRIDLAITSPPYMTRTDHPQNPLDGYRSLDGDYERYLSELADIYRRIGDHLGADAAVVVNAANLRIGGTFTPLAWDIATALSEVLRFEREVVLDWDQPPTWFTNDYCLVFRAR